WGLGGTQGETPSRRVLIARCACESVYLTLLIELLGARSGKPTEHPAGNWLTPLQLANNGSEAEVVTVRQLGAKFVCLITIGAGGVRLTKLGQLECVH